MKFKSFIILALLGATMIPAYGSESVPKTEEESKKRRALVAACSASEKVSKPKSDDERLQDAYAIFNELSGKEVDGDGKGLPPVLRKLVMEYGKQVTAEELFKCAASNNPIFSVARSIDSKGEPVTIEASHRVAIYDKNGEFLRLFGTTSLINKNTIPYSFILTRDVHDKIILTESLGNGEIRIWNSEDNELLSKLKIDEPCMSMAFDKHNTLFGVSGAGDKNEILRVWDINNKTCIKELHVGGCTECVLASDHNNKMIIVVGKSDGHIELWDIKTDKRISVLQGHTEIGASLSKIIKLGGDEKREICGLAVCKNKKNGHLLIASSACNPATDCLDALVYVWDAYTGECVQQFMTDGGVRVVGMDYNDNDELEVYVHQRGNSVRALRCVSGDYEQAWKEKEDIEKATAIIKE